MGSLVVNGSVSKLLHYTTEYHKRQPVLHGLYRPFGVQPGSSPAATRCTRQGKPARQENLAAVETIKSRPLLSPRIRLSMTLASPSCNYTTPSAP